MASGLLNVYVAEPDRRSEVQGYLREVSRRAVSAKVSPSQTPTVPSIRLDDHNLFWSHLALILGIDRYVRCDASVCAEDTDQDRLQERLVRHLLARTMASGVYNARSFPGSCIADVAGLPDGDAPGDEALRRDARHVASTWSLLRGFLRVLAQRADPRTGLFPSAALSPVRERGRAARMRDELERPLHCSASTRTSPSIKVHAARASLRENILRRSAGFVSGQQGTRRRPERRLRAPSSWVSASAATGPGPGLHAHLPRRGVVHRHSPDRAPLRRPGVVAVRRVPRGAHPGRGDPVRRANGEDPGSVRQRPGFPRRSPSRPRGRSPRRSRPRCFLVLDGLLIAWVAKSLSPPRREPLGDSEDDGWGPVVSGCTPPLRSASEAWR